MEPCIFPCVLRLPRDQHKGTQFQTDRTGLAVCGNCRFDKRDLEETLYPEILTQGPWEFESFVIKTIWR